jgi:hypothetical protein
MVVEVFAPHGNPDRLIEYGDDNKPIDDKTQSINSDIDEMIKILQRMKGKL